MNMDELSKQPYVGMPITCRLHEATSKLPSLVMDQPKQYGLKFPNLSHDSVTEICTPILLECGIYYSADVVDSKLEQFKVLAWDKKSGGNIEKDMFVATGMVKVTFYAIGMEDKDDRLFKHSVVVSSSGSDFSQPMFAQGAMLSYGCKYALAKALSIVTGEKESDNSPAHQTQTTPAKPIDQKLQAAAESNGSPQYLKARAKIEDMCKENGWNLGNVGKWIAMKHDGKMPSELSEAQVSRVPAMVSDGYSEEVEG